MNKAITIFSTVFLLTSSSLSIAEIIIQRDSKETKKAQEEIKSGENENVTPANNGDKPSQASNIRDESDRRRFFIQGSLGVSASTNGAKNARFTAGKLSAGMDMTKKFAVEIGTVSFTNVLEYDKSARYLSLVTKFPVAKKVTLLGKFGVASWATTEYFLLAPEIKTSGTSGMIGAELEYKVIDHVSLTLGLDYFGGIQEIPATAGLRIIF